VCTDKQAVAACVRFADDHRVLVEPACGAALSAVYERAPPLLAACAAAPDGAAGVVVEVCGGGVVDLRTLSQWASEFGVE
jgi:L-serine/L-threonine ammonia-lyase